MSATVNTPVTNAAVATKNPLPYEERLTMLEAKLVKVCDELDGLLSKKLSVYEPSAAVVERLMPMALAEATSFIGIVESARSFLFGASYCTTMLRIKHNSALFAAVREATGAPERCVRDRFQIRCDELYQIMHVKALGVKIDVMRRQGDDAWKLVEVQDMLAKSLEATYKEENYVFALKMLANELISSYVTEMIFDETGAYSTAKMNEIVRSARARVFVACDLYAKALNK